MPLSFFLRRFSNSCKPIKLIQLLALLAALAGPQAATAQSAQYLYNQGIASNRASTFVGSVVIFTDLISLAPNLAEAYYQRGLAFRGMGEQDHAAADFAAATARGIQTLDAYLQLIAHYKNSQLFPAALVVTDQIIAYMPENSAGAYWDKGQIYELMGDASNAIAAYQACLQELDADNAGFAETVRARIGSLQ